MNSGITPHVYWIEPEGTNSGGVSGSRLSSCEVGTLSCLAGILRPTSNGLVLFHARYWWVCAARYVPSGNVHQHRGLLHMCHLSTWFQSLRGWAALWRWGFRLCLCRNVLFLWLYTWAQVCMAPLSLVKHVKPCLNTQQICGLGWMCQLVHVLRKLHQVWQLRPQAPSSELKIPK